VQDDILTKLAKIADLKVISRTSVMDYRGKPNLRQIGNDLRVSHVLEGSVRRAGLMKTKLVKSMMTPLLAACALALMVAPTATGQGTRRKNSRGLGAADNDNRLRRSPDKELPGNADLPPGRHDDGWPEHTAGSENTCAGSLAPYH
jgi:hypothetical protein